MVLFKAQIFYQFSKFGVPKMKQRMTILDIRAIVNELNSRLSNTFIQNFYSYEQRFIYIKFSNKDTLLIEPGARIHLCSEYETEISHFCKKLREKCRHARVHEISQFGFDRVIIINILRFRLVIEFYSGGNIVILDENDTIIDLLRTVKELGIEKTANTYSIRWRLTQALRNSKRQG